MERYSHGGDIYRNPNIRYDFSVNTNPLGMPAAVQKALAESIPRFGQYPDPRCQELTGCLADFEGIPAPHILVTNGAADLIFRLCLAVKPKKALLAAPSFSEYEKALRDAGSEVVYHPLREETGFVLQEDYLSRLTPEVEMLFLCNPNNPSGRLIAPELLKRILDVCKKQSILAVVDECFMDFTEEPAAYTAKPFLPDYENLVVIKAFTKTFAMAGLRLGYGLFGSRALMEKVQAFGQSWSVSFPAQVAGSAALESCQEYLRQTTGMISQERAFLDAELSKCGFKVYPSQANFILFQGQAGLDKLLLGKGILIRSCGNFIGLIESYFRIAVRTREENLALLGAVKEVLHG